MEEADFKTGMSKQATQINWRPSANLQEICRLNKEPVTRLPAQSKARLKGLETLRLIYFQILHELLLSRTKLTQR